MGTRVIAGMVLLLLLAPTGQGVQEAEPDPEKEKIEQVVAAMLEAYRTNNYNAMARYYAPEVVMVSGRYEPPLLGWPNLRQAYTSLQAELKEIELIREGTRIERRDSLAWVYYRWSFLGKLREQYLTSLGHTTLILEKRGRDWLILHNHSSTVTPPAPVPPPSPPARP